MTEEIHRSGIGNWCARTLREQHAMRGMSATLSATTVRTAGDGAGAITVVTVVLRFSLVRCL